MNANPELRAGDVKVRSRAYARAAPRAAALTLAEHSSMLNIVMAGWSAGRTAVLIVAATMGSDLDPDHAKST